MAIGEAVDFLVEVFSKWCCPKKRGTEGVPHLLGPWIDLMPNLGRTVSFLEGACS